MTSHCYRISYDKILLTFHFVEYVFGEDDQSFQICLFNCGIQWNVREKV